MNIFNLDIAKTNLGLPEVWEFEVVTPLFIGSGDKLRADTYDFQFSDGRFYYVDYSKFFIPGTLNIRGDANYINTGLVGSPAWRNWNSEPEVIQYEEIPDPAKAHVAVIEETNNPVVEEDPFKTAVRNAKDEEELGDAIGMGDVNDLVKLWPHKKKVLFEAIRLLNRTDLTSKCPRLPKDWDRNITILKYWKDLIIDEENNNAPIDQPPIRDNQIHPVLFNGLDELQTFIRNGFGQPFVPGSSLKGVLRTILATQIDQIEGIIRREGMRFNKDFSGDLGRLLLVFDADSNVTDLGLYKGHFRSNGKWKNYYFEALRPGVTFKSKIKIDKLPELIKKHKPNLNVQEVKFFNDQTDKNKSWYELKSFISYFNKKVVRYQIKCMQESPATALQANDAIDWLKNNVLSNPDQYVQFGGGAGWSSKTGIPAMDKNNQFLQEKRIKNNNIPYPRSVKLVEVDGQKLPMGWVKILK